MFLFAQHPWAILKPNFFKPGLALAELGLSWPTGLWPRPGKLTFKSDEQAVAELGQAQPKLGLNMNY